MNIVFSTYETKEIGGSYLRSLSLAKGLVEAGHSLTLWTSAKNISLFPTVSFIDGVKIVESVGIFPYRFRKGGYDLLDVCVRTIAIIFSKCEVIHTFNHRPSSSVPGLITSCLFPSVTWFVDWADLFGRGGIADRRYGPLRWLTSRIDHYTEQWCIRLADKVTAISNDLVKKAARIRGKKKNVFYLPVGADITAIRPLSKLSSRKKITFPASKKLLAYLYVGTYDEVLLAHTFIELCALRSDVFLLLLGPSIPAFEQAIHPHPDVQKKILHPGVISRTKLPFYLAAADCMLLPFAQKEINLGKFPNKLGDYLAAGRAIVANPTGEVKTFLEKHDVGVLAPENPAAFARTINTLLNNPKKIERLGKNARQTAESFSWFAIAQQLERLYH